MCFFSLPSLPFCSFLLLACPQFSLIPATVPLNSKQHSKEMDVMLFFKSTALPALKIHSKLSPYWIHISPSSSSLSISPHSSNHLYRPLTSPPSSHSSSFGSWPLLHPKKKDSIYLHVSGKSSLKGTAKSLGYGDGSCLFSPLAG